MAHWTQVLVLSHLHLQQAKEIKSQFNKIRCLSTLLEKQQAILERVQEQQSRMPEILVPPINRIEELQREAFNILPGTVNARRGAALAHASAIFQDILDAGRSNFENELAEAATWTSCPCISASQFNVFATCALCFQPSGGLTSTPRTHLDEDRVRARINSNTYPPRYEMKVVVQEFHNLCKPKIKKLKVGYQHSCQGLELD